MIATVYLGLGSNLGEREHTLAEARTRIETSGIEIVACSSLYETEPVGLENQPWFLNQVIEGRSTDRPSDLLRLCKTIERDLGRTEGVRFGPRILDIDILLYGEEIICDRDLVIPHPRMAERRFVLIPLLEINPALKDPRTGTAYADSLQGLDEGKKVFQSLRRES